MVGRGWGGGVGGERARRGGAPLVAPRCLPCPAPPRLQELEDPASQLGVVVHQELGHLLGAGGGCRSRRPGGLPDHAGAASHAARLLRVQVPRQRCHAPVGGCHWAGIRGRGRHLKGQASSVPQGCPAAPGKRGLRNTRASGWLGGAPGATSAGTAAACHVRVSHRRNQSRQTLASSWHRSQRRPVQQQTASPMTVAQRPLVGVGVLLFQASTCQCLVGKR